jgi:DNA repair photolyase
MLRESKGNMYDWVTHTWNPIKGKCPHDCSYCYMKRWGTLKPLRLDEKELETDLGSGNFIFVGSSTDMFAESVPKLWIKKVLDKCCQSYQDGYLFQSKNPSKFMDFLGRYPSNVVFCTTIETNRWYPEIMNNAQSPFDRVGAMREIAYPKYVTIEPIMDFDLPEMVDLIKECNPIQVNIGADSGHNNLPEPSIDKLLQLIEELETFTTINRKSNLQRILR